jgi:hypothetical protein
MGFMDKVKAQAQTLAEKAQEQAKVGQEKLSAMQAKKQSDALLLEIGGIVYSQRVGRADGAGDEKIAALVERLKAFEAVHGEVQVTPADAPVGETGSYIPSSGGTADGGESTVSVPSDGGTVASPAAAPPPAPAAPAAAPVGGIPTATYSSDSEPEAEA